MIKSLQKTKKKLKKLSITKVQEAFNAAIRERGKSMDDTTDLAVKDRFYIICKKCGNEAKIHFYSGYVHSCGGDTGSMSITCECGEKIELS